jgi:methyl-accepting chemotaxis protein
MINLLSSVQSVLNLPHSQPIGDAQGSLKSRRRKHMGIRSKLYLLVAVVLLMMIGLGIASRISMNRADDGLVHVLGASHSLQLHMEGDMMHDALRSDVLAALLAQKPAEHEEARASLKEHVQHFKDVLTENEQTAEHPEVRTALAEVEESLGKYIASAEAIVSLAESNRHQAEAMLPSFTAAFEDLEERMENVSGRIEATAASAKADVHETIRIAKLVGIVVLLLAIAIAAAVSQMLSRSISSGIQQTTDVIARMADGKLGQSEADHRDDEFGRLLELLRVMDGKFSDIVGSVRSSSESIVTAAREVSQGSDDLSRRTQQQATALQQTAASMEQMESTVKQNADNARQASQLAMGARNQADKGGTVVQSAITAMNEINASSRKIADIIGVIDEIAFQTNLLALNAAVEAARAGEQGRGFAVVATEVRNLAQRSAGAAKEIKGLILESVEKVKAGTELVDESGKTIVGIMDSVRKVTDIVAEIATASDEQAGGVEQVNHAVSQMDSVTQQNAALVEQAAAASKSMEQQTQKLVERASFFRIENQQRHADMAA